MTDQSTEYLETEEDEADFSFGDYDTESAPEDPFAIPPGTYEGIITKAEVKTWDNGNKTFFITYQVTEEDCDAQGLNAQDRFNLPKKEDFETVDGKRQRSFLRNRLEDLGYPAPEQKNVKPAMLLEKQVIFTVKKSKGYTNVTSVELRGEAASSVSDPWNHEF